VTFVLVQILNAIWSTLDDNTVSGDTITKTTTKQTSDNNDVTKSLKINELKSLISNDSTTIITNDSNSNGKLHKQQSEQTTTDNGSLSSPTSPPPPPPLLSSLSLPFSIILNSFVSFKCTHIGEFSVKRRKHFTNTSTTTTTPLSSHHISSIGDNLSDEYHEDEDTLSLENLFPCDQTEIYASKKISFIIDEFIQTKAIM
ncbi:hypothetical protein DOY81_011276, partial [Sarcophaga bullata]